MLKISKSKVKETSKAILLKIELNQIIETLYFKDLDLIQEKKSNFLVAMLIKFIFLPLYYSFFEKF